MTISSAASTSLGTYPVTVTGTAGAFSRSSTVSVIVANGVGSNDFQLALAQAFPTNGAAGSSQTAKVSVTPNYSGSVNVTCDDSAMSGAQCSVTPVNPVAISANVAATLTLMLNVPNSAGQLCGGCGNEHFHESQRCRLPVERRLCYLGAMAAVRHRAQCRCLAKSVPKATLTLAGVCHFLLDAFIVRFMRRRE